MSRQSYFTTPLEILTQGRKGWMLPESVEALVLEPYCLLGRYDSESFRRQISHGPHSGTWWEGETHQHTKVEKSQQTWCKIRRDWLKSQMSKSCIAVAWVSILLGRFTMGSQLIKYMLLSYGRIRARGIRFLSQIFQLLTTYPSNSGYVCHRWRLHSSVGHRTSPRPKARLPVPLLRPAIFSVPEQIHSFWQPSRPSVHPL